MIDFCITAYQLRKGLKEIEEAEKNGFKYCLAVFKLVHVEDELCECQSEYSDLIERAHPSDGKFNWGRFQGVTKTNKFKNGKLIPIKKK